MNELGITKGNDNKFYWGGSIFVRVQKLLGFQWNKHTIKHFGSSSNSLLYRKFEGVDLEEIGEYIKPINLVSFSQAYLLKTMAYGLKDDSQKLEREYWCSKAVEKFNDGLFFN